MSFKLENATQRSTTAMLLGSGELGKEVAIELMRLGVHVVACDRYDNAPAMQVAHERAVFDMKDPETLRAQIHRIKPDVVIPEIEAIATTMLMELEEKENLHVVPTARAAYITMNRKQIRTIAAEELGLPTSPYFFATTLEEVKAQIDKVGYPCIMKPVMSSSGKGQSTIKTPEDVETSWNKACTEGRGGVAEVIVEGFVRFEKEITLLTISAADGIHFCRPIFHHQVNGDYHESWQGDELPADIQAECERIASKVVKHLGGHGLFGVELFICPGQENQVVFSELSPRPHDTGMVTMISQDQSEFALHVRALLGLPIGQITFIGPSASAALLVEGDGTTITYENIAEALKTGGAHSNVRIFGKPEVRGERRMGVMLARSTSVEDAVEKAKAMRATIKATVTA
ncbi:MULTISPECIES: formate-dependent phosphoribosylglycinamide formyltransferase [unclassified Anaerobiospirillum]|uniref:formate-dependent phosphoribosylglycinamide formyltransferase n=1 Tax=unclassified Anaerobiospirillum TaxID=2647410 RepID=UPI001FF3243A|nr:MULTISPECIES: formate-dependent phosphoribosylglycinamide formyltransferase [unclassified Anaerobiospirillum]MCK0525590.1 formate-dependent phosphoribosylglycinamide formyltransferase [Anaerobiospirillum sp. NML120449]MCK0533674.1 formate-dependent phosphoribosylglycinamide formyltransferase [Anaerobiospirillum sp. NML120511]MCK0539637.1 formate-dependent phosphoribosylglycinamide formyltransferase [Anaerobiospirillum sp. NML02-A-032]